jgi:hypothetical protein
MNAPPNTGGGQRTRVLASLGRSPLTRLLLRSRRGSQPGLLIALGPAEIRTGEMIGVS